MAMSILTGSLSTTDVTLGGASVKCGFGRLSCQFVRQATSSITFCTSGWVAEIPGMKQMIGSLIGYVTKGVAWSDPLVWINSATPVAFVGTADTDCEITASINVFADGVDLVAAANSARGVDFRSTGEVETDWVVA